MCVGCFVLSRTPLRAIWRSLILGPPDRQGWHSEEPQQYPFHGAVTDYLAACAIPQKHSCRCLNIVCKSVLWTCMPQPRMPVITDYLLHAQFHACKQQPNSKCRWLQQLMGTLDGRLHGRDVNKSQYDSIHPLRDMERSRIDAHVVCRVPPYVTLRRADRAHHSLKCIICMVRGAGMTRKNKGIFSIAQLASSPPG